MVLHQSVANEDFAYFAREADGNRLIFPKFAIIIIQFCQSEDVLGHLIYVGFAVLNINAERLWDFGAVVGAEAWFET